MSKVVSRVVGAAAPYVVSAVGLIPNVAAQGQEHALSPPNQDAVWHTTAAGLPSFGLTFERLDLLPKVLFRFDVPAVTDDGYDEFIADEHFTEGVTYVQAAIVVDEDPPVHFFDRYDLETIARYEE